MFPVRKKSGLTKHAATFIKDRGKRPAKTGLYYAQAESRSPLEVLRERKTLAY
jgi:hypothetical protein